MSNSALISGSYTSHAKRNHPRNNKISVITPHHCAGNMTFDGMKREIDRADRQMSCNYLIQSDGKIFLFVNEEDRSWCSSSATNDHKAITIEVANDGGAPNWHVSDAALSSLIDLCADICRRNGIARLNFTGNTSGNLTQHNYFNATACPGPYLKGKFPYIAEEVNKRLTGTTEPPAPNSGASKDGLYHVQVGAFASKTSAENYAAKVRAAGFDTFVTVASVNGKTVYRVQLGAFKEKANAAAYVDKVKAAGFDAFVADSTSSPAATGEIKAGNTVRVKNGAKTYTGGNLASYVYARNHIVKEISSDRAVITYNGIVVAAVKVSDLTLI